MLFKSKINKRPLFLIKKYHKKKKIKSREDLTDANKFLQVSFLNLKKQYKVAPHTHLKNSKKTNISSEAWIVMSGKLKVTFYDIDNSKVFEDILKSGDISILFEGGHSFKPLLKNTKIFEIKNGPYMGPIKEKVNFKV
jgi:ASC-1-like (ASCH) protein